MADANATLASVTSFIIDTTRGASAEIMFKDRVTGLVFDEERGQLLACRRRGCAVSAYSSRDGSSVHEFSDEQQTLACFQSAVVVDQRRNRVLSVVSEPAEIVVWERADPRNPRRVPMPVIPMGHRIGPESYSLAVDSARDRLIVLNHGHYRVMVLSLEDFSLLFAFDDMESSPNAYAYPENAVIDEERQRIFVSASDDFRVLVFSAADGKFMFEFGDDSGFDDETRPMSVLGVCVDNMGRIILTDLDSEKLHAFSPDGRLLSSITCTGAEPGHLAFDKRRGLIAMSTREVLPGSAHDLKIGFRIHVIGANRWLPDTFVWAPDRQALAPREIARVVQEFTMIRSLEHGSVVALLPNELLFEIFKLL